MEKIVETYKRDMDDLVAIVNLVETEEKLDDCPYRIEMYTEWDSALGRMQSDKVTYWEPDITWARNTFHYLVNLCQSGKGM